MKRIGLFVVVLAAGIVLLLLTSVWYIANFQAGNATVAGMMGQMMGNLYASGMSAPMPSYLWTLFALLFVVTIAGLGGVAYYLAYPEISTAGVTPDPMRSAFGSPSGPKVDWSVLLRTSNPEEKKVLEVVASHDGKYLQKFIVKEAGLSRLKTHRIVSRFVERGILGVVKSGNTNEVSLAPWLKPEANGGKSPSA